MATSAPEDDGGTDDQTVVLHVDDDGQFLDMAAEFLEELDGSLTIINETDPQSGLELLEENQVDVIVSDYQMPEMDGIDFLRGVRENFPNMPFFLLTGKGSEDVASEAIEAGVTSYVQKGGTEVFEQLVNRIENAVERQKSQRRARITHQRLLDLFEQTDGFYILKSDWSIAYWNRQIADRTGLPSEEAIGRNFWEVFPEAKRGDFYENFQTAREADEPVEFNTFYEPFGYWAEVRTYPVDNGLFVHSRDITDEMERREELERRNHIIRSFANTVSHDLRNPLSVAEGRLRLAQDTGDFDHLEEVAEAHNRMRNLINELLRLARGEELTLSEVSLKDLAEKAWKTVTSDTAKLVIKGDMSFEAHESQLRRLFENLFWNAIDHGNASNIRVGTLDDQGFYVEDDGTGIPESDRQEIFESGFTTGKDSPGYGLSIVRGIVDMHEWEISVTEGRTGGARFEIRTKSLEE